MVFYLLFAVALCSLGQTLPQGGVLFGSPTDADCTYDIKTSHTFATLTCLHHSYHEDHWDCATPCAKVIRTRLAIDATLTDWPSWLTSMNSAYSTSGVPWSGSTVFIHTSQYAYP